MKLSIGMIVKNEEKYLKKCLRALNNLQKKVDSELIIVDTGSTDSTVEIAKQFTDKVYHFRWCNDFSAARNEILKYAEGEWFMTLDADEIFIDTDSIEYFFNSGEYKNWVTASVIIDNFSDSFKIDSLSFDAIRLIQRSGDLRYEGAIHEHFKSEELGVTDSVPNCYRLTSRAEHYGYIMADEEFAKSKNQRNREILYAEYEKNKNNPIYFTQLYDLELGAHDYATAEKYAKKCIELAVGSEAVSSVGYMLYADTLYVQNKFEQILIAAEEYFTPERTFDHICDMPMYMYRGVAYFRLQNYLQAVQDFEIYFNLRQQYKNCTTQETYIHPIKGFEADLYILRILECAVSYEQLQDYEQLEKLLQIEEPPFFDNESFFRQGYTRDYIMHAVLLAIEADNRSIISRITQNGSERQIKLMHDIINEISSPQTPQNEFEQYALQIKSAIHSLIDGGMKKQASQLLEQYKQLCPTDKEIAVLENMLI